MSADLPPLSDIVWLQQPLHTWVCVDPSVQPSAASLLSLLDGCISGPALSDGRGWRSELRPEKHSLPLWSDILTGCRKQHVWQKLWENCCETKAERHQMFRETGPVSHYCLCVFIVFMLYSNLTNNKQTVKVNPVQFVQDAHEERNGMKRKNKVENKIKYRK